MKTSEILHQAKNQKKPATGKGLKYLLFLFLLSFISFLPSCAVEVRTPQPGIAIESHHHRFWHHNRQHNEYREHGDHQN